MRSHVDPPHGSLLTGLRPADRQRRLKRLERFDRSVRRSLPLAGTSAAHRAVYEQLMARFGVVILGRHLERIAAILDRAEARAAIFVRPSPVPRAARLCWATDRDCSGGSPGRRPA
jgi:hypothetical protein